MTERTTGMRIRSVRMRRGWTQTRLIYALRREAMKIHGYPPSDASLKAMVSRWENDHRIPDSYNMRLLAAALEVPVTALVGAEPENG